MTKSPVTSPLRESDLRVTGPVLQATLADLVDLSLLAKQAHWNVVGSHFRSLHLHLDELVGIARQYTDEVAERSTAIGISPNGKARTVAETSGLPTFPDGWTADTDTIAAVVAMLDALVKRLRQRIDETDKADLVTQDLLIEIARQIEQQHWMWQAYRA
jgi:starvation-inducible DNA-binding protein